MAYNAQARLRKAFEDPGHGPDESIRALSGYEAADEEDLLAFRWFFIRHERRDQIHPHRLAADVTAGSTDPCEGRAEGFTDGRDDVSRSENPSFDARQEAPTDDIHIATVGRDHEGNPSTWEEVQKGRHHPLRNQPVGVNHVDFLTAHQSPRLPGLHQYEARNQQPFPRRAFQVVDDAPIVDQRFQALGCVAVADDLNAIEELAVPRTCGMGTQYDYPESVDEPAG